MNWSNWVYLGAGLALGVGFRELFARVALSSSYKVPLVEKKDTGVDALNLDQVSVDVPALLQQMKQTQLAYNMAQEISQFKAGFLARTTHVLRSPLNGLIGLHQLILSNLCENPEEEREFISQAHERALKLLKLIDEILNVARTEHGTNKLNIQPQPLAQLLQEVHNLTYMLAENRNLHIQVLEPDPEIHVLVDQCWLRQILINLVDTCIAQMEFGSIYISTGLSHTTNSVYIWLDVPTDAISWSEPIDLIKEDKPPLTDKENAVLLGGMKLLLNQTLLSVMGGKLEILPPDTANKLDVDYTRLQLTIENAREYSELDQIISN